MPHFFATHIMQAMPVLGLALDVFLPKLLVPGLIAGSVVSVAIVAATFIQAVTGAPFF